MGLALRPAGDSAQPGYLVSPVLAASPGTALLSSSMKRLSQAPVLARGNMLSIRPSTHAREWGDGGTRLLIQTHPIPHSGRRGS